MNCLAEPSALSLQNRLGHLLDEQWDAVGALDDILPDALRNWPVSATPSMMASTSDLAIRLIVRGVTCALPIQGGTNSGRNVTRSNTRQGRIRSHSAAERLQARGVGQCASSKITSTGRTRDRTSNCGTERLQRFLRRCSEAD